MVNMQLTSLLLGGTPSENLSSQSRAYLASDIDAVPDTNAGPEEQDPAHPENNATGMDIVWKWKHVLTNV